MSEVTEPTTRVAIGCTDAPYRAMSAVWVGSLVTSRVATSLVARTSASRPVARSIVRSTRVNRRPYDPALVTRWPATAQL